MTCRLPFLCALAWCLTDAAAADWIRAGVNTNQPVWGVRGGLVWAIHPAGFRPGEPRGLIRLGYPLLPGGRYDLINFIAVEPVVNGRKGFSELERSKLDKVRGKRIWAEGDVTARRGFPPGWFSDSPSGMETLEVTLKVEAFDNGAHVYLGVRQHSNRPDEIELTAHTEPDSAPLDYCILTATMGNLARTRQLWLKDEVVSSLKLYPNHKDTGFAPHTEYPVGRLPRTADGSVLVAITTDEGDPAAVHPFPNSRLWYYGGQKVTQYWRKAPGTFHDDLHAAVNARYTYWQMRRAIPGGVAFENFELRERFHEGQQCIFGITSKTPAELGLRGKVTHSDRR